MAKMGWKKKEVAPEPGLTEMEILMLAVAELDEQRAVDKTENEMVVAELAEIMLGGM